MPVSDKEYSTFGGISLSDSLTTIFCSTSCFSVCVSGDWEKVDSLISDDFKYEADGRPAIGKQEYIGFMRNALSNAFTEMDMDFLHVIAEDYLVSVNYTNKMTHVGEFLGVPATQKRVIATGQFIREVKTVK